MSSKVQLVGIALVWVLVGILAGTDAAQAAGPLIASISPNDGLFATPRDQFAFDPHPAAAWLGLDGNSGGVKPASLRDFAANGIVYDRGGGPWLDWTAGELLDRRGRPTEGGTALAVSTRAGMIPDVTIEYRAYHGYYQSDPDFPERRTRRQQARGMETISGYVKGFIASAEAIHARYPSAIFEPMNEPWGYTTPQYNAAEYANVIAKLLPAVKAAGIPLSSIYVGAASRSWVTAMYAAHPQLETGIQGWYLHPYGPPNSAGENQGDGIQSLPEVRQAMTSGQNNIIVSEVGYCAVDVNNGADCAGEDRESSAQAARNLTEMLDNALPYHQAGWLRALIVFARSDGGWAMQLRDGSLTAQGQALQSFALSLL
jgi:hypothetical protein